MKNVIVLFTLCCIVFSNAFAQSEPTQIAGNFEALNVLPFGFKIKYAPAADANGYLVLRSSSAVVDVPVDGTEYKKGEWIGDSKVFYSGSANNVALGIKEVVANTTYHFAVYSYNSGAVINYLTGAALKDVVTTPGLDAGSYYDAINSSASDLISQLTNLIQPHIAIPYAQFDENIVSAFFEKDTIIGGVSSKYVTCQYSNEKRTYTGIFEYVTPQPGYSREHRMAFSWINFEGITRDEFEERPEGNDIHSLDLLNTDVNSTRSSYSFGEINGNPWSSSYLDFEIGTDIDGTTVAVPMPQRKGDVARALYYMMLCYNGKYGENWGLDNLLGRADQQDVAILKTWHEQDPVDDFEIARHEYVASIQNNRNPFIDFPELVDCIDFTDMSLKSGCNVDIGVGIIDRSLNNQIQVYPNPANNQLFIVNSDLVIERITVVDALGATVKVFRQGFDKGMNIESLSPGFYLVKVHTNNEELAAKILVEGN